MSRVCSRMQEARLSPAYGVLCTFFPPATSSALVRSASTMIGLSGHMFRHLRAAMLDSKRYPRSRSGVVYPAENTRSRDRFPLHPNSQLCLVKVRYPPDMRHLKAHTPLVAPCQVRTYVCHSTFKYTSPRWISCAPSLLPTRVMSPTFSFVRQVPLTPAHLSC
ncbi:hypothetical protein L227DRAFT_88643 [Lentinus tigrinus ALCF2SS1-6]|uniref:Uncharacterized protein n=1 Tax=Lentinus tigrinus ALCF2SS1-6 TaxID=1328759 RepID=A0A5C2SB60_9APHY|nr:hypothetical protein L227DRAFT_88643 [Lentinus tigrinus ALCF2SS1-6]